MRTGRERPGIRLRPAGAGHRQPCPPPARPAAATRGRGDPAQPGRRARGDGAGGRRLAGADRRRRAARAGARRRPRRAGGGGHRDAEPVPAARPAARRHRQRGAARRPDRTRRAAGVQRPRRQLHGRPAHQRRAHRGRPAPGLRPAAGGGRHGSQPGTRHRGRAAHAARAGGQLPPADQRSEDLRPRRRRRAQRPSLRHHRARAGTGAGGRPPRHRRRVGGVCRCAALQRAQDPRHLRVHGRPHRPRRGGGRGRRLRGGDPARPPHGLLQEVRGAPRPAGGGGADRRQRGVRGIPAPDRDRLGAGRAARTAPAARGGGTARHPARQAGVLLPRRRRGRPARRGGGRQRHPAGTVRRHPRRHRLRHLPPRGGGSAWQSPPTARDTSPPEAGVRAPVRGTRDGVHARGGPVARHEEAMV